MNDLVSFLMCVYNTPILFVRQAVDSMLNQTYKPCEIVLVDDCSDDEELLEYIDKLDSGNDSVNVIHNITNMGLTKSLNIGLGYCKGSYIARMDSDDISMPDRISLQVKYLDEHPDVPLVGSRITSFGDTYGEMDSSYDDRYEDPEIYRISSLIRHSGPPHPTFMFRADYLKEHNIKYREDIIKAQDYGIMVDIIRTGGAIRIVNRPLLKYRVHSGQITCSSGVEQKAYQCRVSFDFVKSEFPLLSESECAAVSLLGCTVPWSELVETINNTAGLKKICHFITDNTDSLTDPSVYINAIKKLLLYNKKVGTFNGKKLESELRYELWKKSIHMSQCFHRIWGIRPYILLSYGYVIKRRYRNTSG